MCMVGLILGTFQAAGRFCCDDERARTADSGCVFLKCRTAAPVTPCVSLKTTPYLHHMLMNSLHPFKLNGFPVQLNNSFSLTQRNIQKIGSNPKPSPSSMMRGLQLAIALLICSSAFVKGSFAFGRRRPLVAIVPNEKPVTVPFQKGLLDASPNLPLTDIRTQKLVPGCFPEQVSAGGAAGVSVWRGRAVSPQGNAGDGGGDIT